MALDNYANLQTAIGAWANRTDLGPVAPDFITLFETEANSELPLRTRFNLTYTTINTLPNTETIDLPGDFLEAKALVNTDPLTYAKVLNYRTPAQLHAEFPYSLTAPNRPKAFTYAGSNLILAPVPDAIYPLRLYYYQKITALSTAEGGTNWLLENFPNLYLFGSLLAAETYLGSDPRIQVWQGLYNDLVAKLSTSNERGEYGGSALIAKADVVA